MRAVALLMSLCVSSCSFATVRASKPADPLRCTQSNWAAGVDFTVAVASSTAAVVLSRDKNIPVGWAVASAILATGTTVSLGYGWGKTQDCRSRVRLAGLEARGGYDWLITPLAGVAIIAVIAMAMSAKGGSGPASRDICKPGAMKTALCKDGSWSCATSPRGQCSWHGGVQGRCPSGGCGAYRE